MESALTKACTIKIQNFEGPFDLLYHLIEKNQLNIYDIPINDITDQYMDYLFAMQQMDLEIASEFLVMAATLLHIKSKMLLPDKKEKVEDEIDPREELITRLIEYKKYKGFSHELKDREKEWEKAYYKLPEIIEIKWEEEEILELNPDDLKRLYLNSIDRFKQRQNKGALNMAQIIQHEKVTLKSKIKEVVGILLKKTFFKFSDVFTLKDRSKVEVLTGFLAILELSKLKKAKLEQQKQFSDILVYRNTDAMNLSEDVDSIAAEN